MNYSSSGLSDPAPLKQDPDQRFSLSTARCQNQSHVCWHASYIMITPMPEKTVPKTADFSFCNID
jgi:hypothetical protein